MKTALGLLEKIVSLIEFTNLCGTHENPEADNMLSGASRLQWLAIEPKVKSHLWSADLVIYTEESIEAASLTLLSDVAEIVKSAQKNDCGFVGDNEEEWRSLETEIDLLIQEGTPAVV